LGTFWQKGGKDRPGARQGKCVNLLEKKLLRGAANFQIPRHFAGGGRSIFFPCKGEGSCPSLNPGDSARDFRGGKKSKSALLQKETGPPCSSRRKAEGGGNAALKRRRSHLEKGNLLRKSLFADRRGDGIFGEKRHVIG